MGHENDEKIELLMTDGQDRKALRYLLKCVIEAATDNLSVNKSEIAERLVVTRDNVARALDFLKKSAILTEHEGHRRLANLARNIVSRAPRGKEVVTVDDSDQEVFCITTAGPGQASVLLNAFNETTVLSVSDLDDIQDLLADSEKCRYKQIAIKLIQSIAEGEIGTPFPKSAQLQEVEKVSPATISEAFIRLEQLNLIKKNGKKKSLTANAKGKARVILEVIKNMNRTRFVR